MKHCPTCSCELQPDCPACAKTKKRQQMSWDVHAWAKKIRNGEITASGVSREVGLSRQAIEQGLKKHQENDTVEAGRQARREAKTEVKEAERRRLADQPNMKHRIAHPKGERSIPSEYMIESLQAVHRFLKLDGQPMPHSVYGQMRPKHLPSPAAIMDRFGTWNAAMTAAGLPIFEPIRSYTRISKERVVEDVKRFVVAYRTENGRYARVGAAKYERWATIKDNRAVSKALIAKRFGWGEILGEALEELYGDGQLDTTED